MTEGTNVVKVATPEQVAKVVTVKFEGTKMIVAVDTNKDGEPSIEMIVNLAETADEVMDKFFK